ncbi:permease, partial [candidate division KSB1 bacterium]
MNIKKDWKIFSAITAGFLLLYYLPVGNMRFNNAVIEALQLAKWYAREHVLLCLVPAFFIAGAIAVFVSKNSVIKYLGSAAKKTTAYGVASVSGAVLAVCSCTILPLFAGIYRMGAGIGPASAFLYAGPAVNVLAIILTARILGFELGIARAVGAVVFSIVIGMMMELFFRKEEAERVQAAVTDEEPKRTLAQNAIFFAMMVGILVFANWGRPDADTGFWSTVFESKWLITAFFWIGLSAVITLWFGIRWQYMAALTILTLALGFLFRDNPVIAFSAGFIGLSFILVKSPGEPDEWLTESWMLAKQIIPLLLAGVLVSGLLLGRPGGEGIIPSEWIAGAVGGNSFGANLFASFAGALMYFATLTEVPILQGLIGNGMGNG